jgi:PAS domain S-box-containing protein
MNALIERKYINGGFVFALLILLSISFITFLNTTDHFDDEKWVNRVLNVIHASEMLISKLSDAEANRQGFVITSNEEFLKQYYYADSQSDSIFTVIQKLTSYNQKQKVLTDSLSPLLNLEKEVLHQSIDIQNKKPVNQNELVELTNKGKQIQSKIKYLVSRLQAEEKEILEQRNKELESSGKLVIWLQIIGTVAALLILITGMVLMNRILKSRVESEKALERSMNWLSATLKSIGDGVIVTNRLGDITFMNPLAQELTGWKEQEAKGIYLEHIFKLIDEQTGKQIENPVTKVFKSGRINSTAGNALLINKDGREIPVDNSSSPIISNNGSLIGVILVFRDISERRASEIEIQKNQKFIQRIAESIPNILYVYELEGPRIVYANQKLKEILGYSSQEVINMGGRFFNEIMNPDDFSRLKGFYKGFVRYKDTQVMESEFRIKNTAGQWRWMHSYDVIFSRSKSGIPTQVIGTALDVTEKKEMEQQLKKYRTHLEEVVKKRTSELVITNEKLHQEIIERIKAEKSISEAEEKFRTLVEFALVGIYIIQDEKFIYTNPKFEEIYGYGPDEFIGSNIYDAVHPDYIDTVRGNIIKRVDSDETGVQYAFKAIRKDGNVIDVEVRGMKMMYEGRTAIIGTLQDITERKRAEDALREQEEFLRVVLNSNPSFIYVKDWDGRFVLVNDALAEEFSKNPAEITGKTVVDLVGDRVEFSEKLEEDREIMSSLEPKLITEEHFKNNNGAGERWLQTIKVPLPSENGSRRLLYISTDITARKHAEENMKKSLKEKELLLQEIHHRVKNNLQIIVSLLKLQSKYIFDARDLEIFNKSRARVETMSLIHEKLYKSADLSNINMGNYLRDLTGHLFKAYGVGPEDVSLVINSEDVNVGMDTAIPCGLIINELISNSLKHAFGDNQKGRIGINVSVENGSINLKVCDNGIGLPKDFDFEKTDTLGLQLVSTLIKQLDGEILTKSSLIGTEYSITFPELRYKERI